MSVFRPIERRMNRVMSKPPSVRLAASVIVVATTLAVIGGGVLMRLLDEKEYSNVWVGMWWALQTVTTVGYGDVTPKDHIGRIVASFVMLEGIAFLTIVTAVITSTFVGRATQERVMEAQTEEERQLSQLEAHFSDLNARLDRLEGLLGRLSDGRAGATEP